MFFLIMKRRRDRRLKTVSARHGHAKVETETELVKKIVSWILQPKFIILLILINLAAYFWSATLSPQIFENLTFHPENILNLNFPPIIASWFLHANLAHLTANLIFLYVFGRVVERKFGAFKTALIYFGAAIISDLISGLVFQQGGIGASGAIAGLIAAAVIIDPFYLNYIIFGLPIPIVVLGWVAIFADILGLIKPLETSVGHIAHLAGFFGITLLIFLFNRKNEKIKKGFLINILTIAVVVALHFFNINIPNIIQRFTK